MIQTPSLSSASVLLLAISCAPPGPSIHRQLSRVSDGVFISTQPTWEATIDASGLSITGGGALTLRFSHWGRTSSIHPVSDAPPVLQMCTEEPCVATITRDFGDLSEWWRATDRALEQGWTVSERPEGVGLLRLRIDTNAELTSASPHQALLRDPTGVEWRYDHLAAWDAIGQPVPISLHADSTGWELRVDDTKAVYPLTIDPTLTSTELVLQSSAPQAEAFFGRALAMGGDINGDHVDDLLVGAFKDNYTNHDEGAVYLFPGSPNGLASVSPTVLNSPYPQAGARFGSQIVSGANFNHDAYDDFIISAHTEDRSHIDQGVAYLYYGSGSHTAPVYAAEILAPTPAANDHFGFASVLLGDIDGDGLDDFAISAKNRNNNTAVVYIYNQTLTPPYTPVPLTASDGQPDDKFGSSLAAADVDGDGDLDLIVGAQQAGANEGAAYVYLNNNGHFGPVHQAKLTLPTTTPNTYFGRSVASAGFLNNDQYEDILIGAVGAQADPDNSITAVRGTAYVYLGSSTGIDPAAAIEVPFPVGATADDLFGGRVSGLGDIDGNGTTEIMVAAKGTQHNQGAVYVFSYTGDPAHPFTLHETLQPAAPSTNDRFGGAIAGGGDLNNDGTPDLAVGVDLSVDSLNNAGSVYVYTGCNERAFYLDDDGDGYGDPTAQSAALCAPPPQYVDNNTDCDDSDPAIHPAAPEICDGLDNDCDHTIPANETDHDNDNYVECTPINPANDLKGGDCDDNDPEVRPDAVEVCDGIDNDCDGFIDDADDVPHPSPWYADLDHDGYGTTQLQSQCAQPPSAAPISGDCADSDPAIHPGAPEICVDGIDNDCDNLIDDDDPDFQNQIVEFWPDHDHDGFGDSTHPYYICSVHTPPGYIEPGTPDCDDSDSNAFPGNLEICDSIDNNCDDHIDEGLTTDYWPDQDGDGFGDSHAVAAALCAAIPSYVENHTDCDDHNPEAFPTNTEQCDATDNDCNGLIDDNLDVQTYYPDSDGDGFGDSTSHGIDRCAPDPHEVTNADDCDDNDPQVHPNTANINNRCEDVPPTPRPVGCGCRAISPHGSTRRLFLFFRRRS